MNCAFRMPAGHQAGDLAFLMSFGWEMMEARDGIEPPIRTLQALPLAVLGTAPQL